jgi:Cys-rich four helix bundle protein (predicted Tat secretion target)
MDRRELLMATGAALAAVSLRAGAAAAAEHHHDAAGSPLVHAASHCVETANACLAHCLDRLADGDKSMAACARTVTGLIAVCNALGVLAAQHSPLLPKYAAVAAEVCKACEDECNKHSEHPPCKACADACHACAAECANIAS